MAGTFRAAAVQAAPVFMNLDASIDKAIALIEEAARNGADLIGFPECFLPGYPSFIWLDAPIWGLQFIPDYHANSLAIDSPEMRRLCAAVHRVGVYVMIGFSERDGGSRYIAQALIGPDGDLLLTRRKLRPTHVERTVYGDGDGSGLRAVDTALGRIGGLCCWEHLQPLVKMAMHGERELVHVAAWPSFSLYRDMAYALGPEANLAASMTYAVEGSSYVIAASALAGQDMFDRLCDTPAKAHLLNPRTGQPGGGYSMIFGPDGRPLAEALPDTVEGLIYADIDPTMAVLAKAAADPVGHYARPDVLRLMIDRSRRQVIEESSLSAIVTDVGGMPPRIDDATG